MASRKHMQGAVAIEFALVFSLFIALLYAIVSYALVFMLVQSFTYASEDGLRAAIAADCNGLTADECENDVIRPTVQAQVATSLGWLPADVRNLAIGANGSEVDVDCIGGICEVIIRYDYAANPLIPILRLPVFGDVPRVPQNLTGRASLRL